MLGKHLLGLYEKALAPEFSWEERLCTAKKLGFDYMEISIDETDERISRLYESRETIEALRRTCYEAKLPILTMCLSAHRRFPFGSADPAVREKAYELMEKAIDFAFAMGIRVIQLAGYDVYYEQSTAQSVQLFREGMEWAAKKAAQKQVMLAMEIMDTPFMNSITKHLCYEHLFHSPWYKVYPDLGNLTAWPENNAAEELAKGIGSIVAVHLKDTIPPVGDQPGQFKCVPFGAGCVDFSARFQQLESLGYRGPYMIEMWCAPGTDGTADAAAAKEWITGKYECGMAKSPGAEG